METPTTFIPPISTPEPQPPPLPTATPNDEPLLATPPAPVLTEKGHSLILEFETSGRAGYNPRPEWPRGASGVTIGVGYDLGYSSRSVIFSDWKALKPAPLARLARASGVTGQHASGLCQSLHDIIVRWELALDVFDTVDVARWYAASKRALPGFEELRPNAQAALISLGFNRGWSFIGPNRAEMRAIRDLVPEKDYAGMADQERKMCRLWRGSQIERGMTRRRYAEAGLLLTP